MNKNIILDIKNLKASIENKAILKDLNLKVKKKEVHVIMGPNGSGKSTLSKILAGHPSYTIQDGKINFCNQNLLPMLPEKRAHEGIFLAFQYPIEIAGVTNYDFLRIAYNEKPRQSQKIRLHADGNSHRHRCAGCHADSIHGRVWSRHAGDQALDQCPGSRPPDQRTGKRTRYEPSSQRRCQRGCDGLPQGLQMDS